MPRPNRRASCDDIRPRCVIHCLPRSVGNASAEITDNLVELLIHIAHRVSARAETKVGGELLEYAKKVMGKTKLLYKIAKAATRHPDGAVKEVISPPSARGLSKI